MLKVVTAVDLRVSFKKMCDDVMAGATVIVARPKGNNVVLLSENAYNALLAAAHKEGGGMTMPGAAGISAAASDGAHRFAGDGTRPENTKAAVAGVSAIDTVIVPGTALLCWYIACFSGVVSFSLRPAGDKRMLVIGTALFLGIFIGGAVFPHFLEWARRQAGTGGKLLLAAWLSAAAIAVLPGLDAYIFNEPLRILANFFLGLMVAPAYALFFSRFPVAWRGTFFGTVYCLAILCWNVLTSLSFFHPRANGDAFHPFQAYIFPVHATALCALAAACLYALFAQRPMVPATESPFVQTLEMDSRRKLVRAFLLSAFIISVLTGILDAKNTPVFPDTSRPVMSIVLALCVTLATPVTGWFLDRRPERMYRLVLPVCCWVIILTPTLALIDGADWLFAILQAAAVATESAFLVLSTVAVAGLASSPGAAVRWACIVLTMRMLVMVGHLAWVRWLDFGPGSTLLAALALAYPLSGLAARITRILSIGKTVPPEEDAPADFIAATPARIPDAGHDDGMAGMKRAAFLHSCFLTSREREIAEMLLDGRSITDISTALDIKENTVKKHAAGLYKKYGVKNRHELFKLFAETVTGNQGRMHGVSAEKAIVEAGENG